MRLNITAIGYVLHQELLIPICIGDMVQLDVALIAKDRRWTVVDLDANSWFEVKDVYSSASITVRLGQYSSGSVGTQHITAVAKLGDW